MKQRWRVALTTTLIVVVIGGLTAAFSLTNIGCTESPQTPGQVTNESGAFATGALGQVEFRVPISLTEAITLANTAGVTVVQVQHSFLIGQQPYRGFLPVTEGSPASAIELDLSSAYSTFLADMLASSEALTPGPELGPEAAVSYSAMRRGFSDALLNADGFVPDIDGMTFLGDEKAILAISAVAPVRIHVAEEPGLRSSPEPSPTWVDPSTWAPRGGGIAILQSTSGQRYVRQDMLWSNVSNFGWVTTYEHDFFLNHSPGSPSGTYLDRSQHSQWNYRGIPIVAYASSSLPRAYLDTRLGDSQYEISYTIGSAHADAIATNTWYTSYILTTNGDVNTDNAKLTAQLGYRLPPNDFSVWGSYSLQQERIFPAWTIPVPTAFSWQR